MLALRRRVGGVLDQRHHRLAMNRAVRTGVPVRVTSLTSMIPRRLVMSTRRPARVAATS